MNFKKTLLGIVTLASVVGAPSMAGLSDGYQAQESYVDPAVVACKADYDRAEYESTTYTTRYIIQNEVLTEIASGNLYGKDWCDYRTIGRMNTSLTERDRYSKAVDEVESTLEGNNIMRYFKVIRYASGSTNVTGHIHQKVHARYRF